MATRVTKQELLDSEFEVLATRDPEIFFEAMLISLRDNTMEPLDNKRLRVQKIIFKRWFTQYEKRIREEAEEDSKTFNDAFKKGIQMGRLQALEHLPVKRTLLGHRIDTKAITRWIQELQRHA